MSKDLKLTTYRTPTIPHPTARIPPPDPRVWPECAGPLARNAACVTCIQCGWGRCG